MFKKAISIFTSVVMMSSLLGSHVSAIQTQAEPYVVSVVNYDVATETDDLLRLYFDQQEDAATPYSLQNETGNADKTVLQKVSDTTYSDGTVVSDYAYSTIQQIARDGSAYYGSTYSKCTGTRVDITYSLTIYYSMQVINGRQYYKVTRTLTQATSASNSLVSCYMYCSYGPGLDVSDTKSAISSSSSSFTLPVNSSAYYPSQGEAAIYTTDAVYAHSTINVSTGGYSIDFCLPGDIGIYNGASVHTMII